MRDSGYEYPPVENRSQRLYSARQSSKRNKIPAVLEIKEVGSLLGAVALCERTMTLLDVVYETEGKRLSGFKMGRDQRPYARSCQ